MDDEHLYYLYSHQMGKIKFELSMPQEMDLGNETHYGMYSNEY